MDGEIGFDQTDRFVFPLEGQPASVQAGALAAHHIAGQRVSHHERVVRLDTEMLQQVMKNLRGGFAGAEFARDHGGVEIHPEAGRFYFLALQAGRAVGQQTDAQPGLLQGVENRFRTRQAVLQFTPAEAEKLAQLFREFPVLDPLLLQCVFPDRAAELRRPFTQMPHVILLTVEVTPHPLEGHDAKFVAPLDRRVGAPQRVASLFGRRHQPPGIETVHGGPAGGRLDQRLA